MKVLFTYLVAARECVLYRLWRALQCATELVMFLLLFLFLLLTIPAPLCGNMGQCTFLQVLGSSRKHRWRDCMCHFCPILFPINAATPFCKLLFRSNTEQERERSYFKKSGFALLPRFDPKLCTRASRKHLRNLSCIHVKYEYFE